MDENNDCECVCEEEKQPEIEKPKAKTEKKPDCGFKVTPVPDKLRRLYFPDPLPQSFDVLPMFVLQDYYDRVVQEVSILENPVYKQKWKEFNDGLPHTYRNIKLIKLKSSKLPCFMNYLNQQHPPKYFMYWKKATNAQAIFRKTTL